MCGLWIAAILAGLGEPILLENKAITKAVTDEPHLQSSYYDLHQAYYSLIAVKQLTVR